MAQQFARRYHHRTRRLVLACTYAHNGLSRRERIENTALLWLMRLLGTRAVARIAAHPGIGGGTLLTPERTRWLRNILASNDTVRMVEAMRAMITFDRGRWLGEISCPTLVPRGSEDNAVPMAHSQMLAREIKDAQLRVVEGAGHTLIWTHAEELVEQTEQWCSSSRRLNVAE